MFSFWLVSSKVWKFKRKGRATCGAGKNEMCLVLDLLVDNYTYITGDAELLRLVICTELKIQERNPVTERNSNIGSDTFIDNAFHFKKQSNFLVFWLCFKIVQVITSAFKLRSSVMHGVFKMQVVFLETWETVCCTWSPSVATFPSVLEWPLLQAPGKMRSWQKA